MQTGVDGDAESMQTGVLMEVMLMLKRCKQALMELVMLKGCKQALMEMPKGCKQASRWR
jgi:hypothetical protein